MRALDFASSGDYSCSQGFVGRVHDPVYARFVCIDVELTIEILPFDQVEHFGLQNEFTVAHKSSNAAVFKKDQILFIRG